MTTEPSVSVVIPNYKTDEYLSRAIDSVLNQTYGEHEILLVDSSGTDTVREIADSSKQISYQYTEPEGVAAARNLALDRMTGEFVAFLDADDYWAPKKTEYQLEILRSTDADFVYSDEYLLTDGNCRYHETLPIDDPERHFVEYFRRGTGIPIRTVMVRQSCLGDKRFWEELAVREDPHLWVRLLLDYSPCRIAEPLAYKILRDNSLTADIDRLYECELNSVQDLKRRIPELHGIVPERKANTNYKYGKQFLMSERPNDARVALRKSLQADRSLNTIVLLLLTFMPISSIQMKRVAVKLEQLYRLVS